MRVLVNGEPTEVPEGSTVRDAAVAFGVEPEARGMALALDGEVVPRAMLATIEVRAGQRIEVVTAIQGGS